MSAEDPFNLYSEFDPVAPASKKNGSRQHRGESSSNPPTKKAQTGDPPVSDPSKETTPPPAPINQSSPPAPEDQTLPPSPANQTPPTPADQTPPDQTVEALMNMALNLAKDRLTKLSRHRRSQEAIGNTDSMEVEQIFNLVLNEVLSGVLTMSAVWRCSRALTAQYKKRLGEQLRASEDKHAGELKMAEAKYTKQLEEAEKKNAGLLRQKAKLAEEVK
ncbi:uncharacterized protein LOC133785223 [Humulus lupulus]|uniref:uncharacterized protein LOC133785223 n=1 Tax=Humulus lupulus TaxID=3486 RepID=UPI002B40A516|nr:uncharacterized protein LOC133785223 [Humulus lupulus]